MQWGSQLRPLLFEAEISGQVRLAHEEGKAQGNPCWTEWEEVGQFEYEYLFQNQLQTLENYGADRFQDQRYKRTLVHDRGLHVKRERLASDINCFCGTSGVTW